MGFCISKCIILKITCLIARTWIQTRPLYIRKPCRLPSYSVYRQRTPSAHPRHHNHESMRCHPVRSLVAISPRLFVSKGTPPCHFLLRQIRLFHLKYIPFISCNTFSPLKENVDTLAPLLPYHDIEVKEKI